jgi:Xaa-Pro aminopeptidase
VPNDWNDVRGELDVSANFADLVNSPWYGDAVYAKFSREEYERRHAAARALMDVEGVDALLLTGGQNIYSMGSGVVWGSGLVDDRAMCQYMVLPREGDATLVYPHPGCHIEAARQMVGIGDVRDGRHGHYAQVVADRLRELGLERGTVGVTIVDRTGNEFLGQHAYEVLREELPELSIRFLPDALHQLTLRKSAEELSAMAKAGQLALAGLEAVLNRAAPEVAEYQLAAAATHAILDGGGKPHLIMIGSTSMAAPSIVFPNPLPSGRRLMRGDVILGEISATYMGYSAKIGHPISIGPPSARYAGFYADVVLPGFEQIRAELRDGVGLEQVQAAGGHFRAAGAQSRPILMHGLDLITSDPFVMTDRIRAAEFERTLQTGMTVNIEITPIDATGVLGIFLSRSFAITDGDPVELTPYPLDEILVAG